MPGLFDSFKTTCSLYPDNIFIKSGERAWTFHQVYRMSKIIAKELADSGLEAGDRAVIFCDNSIQYVAAFFALLMTDAVLVPVNPSKMEESVAYIIEKCSPRIVAGCNSSMEKLKHLVDRYHVPDTTIVNLDRMIRFDSEWIPDADFEEKSRAVEDTVMILFTSGTTSRPKGVELSQLNLVSNSDALSLYLKLDQNDSILLTIPFSYSYGNSILLGYAKKGGCIILSNASAYPYAVLQQIREYRVTGFSTVGSYINLMLKSIRNLASPPDFFSSLRYITFAGESTNTDDIAYIREHYPHIQIFVFYGQTESAARLSFLPPDRIGDKMGSIGKGIGNIELKVVDESGNSVVPGEIGEIIARGSNVMKGYYMDSDATGEILVDGWLYTGDLATVDEDGFIYIRGRKSDMIKYMGHRISPVEIENVINSCRCVKESAVVESVLDSSSCIKAFVVPDGNLVPDAVRRHANSRLPAYMRPHLYEVVDELPRTESGKIMRSVLRKR